MRLLLILLVIVIFWLLQDCELAVVCRSLMCWMLQIGTHNQLKRNRGPYWQLIKNQEQISDSSFASKLFSWCLCCVMLYHITTHTHKKFIFEWVPVVVINNVRKLIFHSCGICSETQVMKCTKCKIVQNVAQLKKLICFKWIQKVRISNLWVFWTTQYYPYYRKRTWNSVRKQIYTKQSHISMCDNSYQ